MKTLRLFVLIIIPAFVLASVATQAAELSAEDKTFLTSYEKIGSALAGDNLATAKQAAAELGEQGAALSGSEKIDAARAEFSKLSERAIQLGRGQSGYYVVNCPMLRKDWLQSSTKISNPYAGSSMPECGVIRK